MRERLWENCLDEADGDEAEAEILYHEALREEAENHAFDLMREGPD